MALEANLKKIYIPSQDIVARVVQGEFIIIPITSGIGDAEDEIFSLNENGRAIWHKLDGKKSLKEVAKNLSLEFEGSIEEIEKDVLGLAEELFKRKMIIEPAAG